MNQIQSTGETQQVFIEINAAFYEPVKMAQSLEGEYAAIVGSQIISPELCTRAGELRKTYVKIRTGTEKIHKKEKAFYLEVCQKIDAIKRSITEFVVEREKALKEVEEYYQNLRKKEIERIRLEREELLKPYLTEGDAIPDNLGEMDEFVFAAFLEGVKVKHKLKPTPEQKVYNLLKTIDVSDCSDEFKKEFNDFLLRISKFTN